MKNPTRSISIVNKRRSSWKKSSTFGSHRIFTATLRRNGLRYRRWISGLCNDLRFEAKANCSWHHCRRIVVLSSSHLLSWNGFFYIDLQFHGTVAHEVGLDDGKTVGRGSGRRWITDKRCAECSGLSITFSCVSVKNTAASVIPVIGYEPQ